MAVIPQMADAKWLNQFKSNAAKSSGECGKKTQGEGGGRGRKNDSNPSCYSKTEEIISSQPLQKKTNKIKIGGSRKTKRDCFY